MIIFVTLKRWSMKTKLMEITYHLAFAQFKQISCLISAWVIYSSIALKSKRVFPAAFCKVLAIAVRIKRTNKTVSNISLLKRSYYTR